MRFEKDGGFVEIALEGARVHVAKGTKAMTDSDVRTYIFEGDEDAARESYDERVAEVVAKGFAPAGEDTPIITSYLAKRDADRAQNDAAALLAKGMRGKSREQVIAEAQAILDRWHAALARLDEVTANSLGNVYAERITRLEELIRGG
jgi:hypothetical protein